MFDSIRRSRRLPWLSFLVLAIAASALTWLIPTPVQSAPADAAATRYVEIAEIAGEVTYQGRPVAAGDRLPAADGEGLQTGPDGRAQLRMDDTIGTVEVEPESQLQVTGLNILPSGGKTTEMRLARGRARVRVRRFNNPDSRFDVRTPAGNAGVRGTEFSLYVRSDGETHMSVLDGLVEFSGDRLEEPFSCRPGTGWIFPVRDEPVEGGAVFGDLNLRFELLADRSDRVRVSANTNGTNTVRLNGEPVAIDRQGRFEEVVAIPSDRRLRLVIRDLFDREQTYELFVPN